MNEKINKVSAFVLIKKGTDNVVKKVIKVSNLWAQIGISYGYISANKVDEYTIVSAKDKLMNYTETEECRIDLKRNLSLLENFHKLSVDWVLNEYDIREIVLSKCNYERIVKELRHFEEKNNLVRSGNAKVMNYDEGVCFVAPTLEDSLIYSKLLEIIEIKE